MPRTRADLSHGQSVHEIELRVLDELDAPDGIVAYDVRDSDDESFVVTGEAETAPSLKTGERYRFEQALGSDSDFDEEEAFAEQYARADDTDCPRCGGELTFSSGREAPSDAVQEYLAALRRPGVHLVLCEDSNAVLVSGGDDWRPLGRSRSSPPARRGVYRCAECEFSVQEGQLRTYTADEGTVGAGPVHEEGAQPVAQELHQNVVQSDLMDESIGMATGGAKDVDNFRENVENGYLPDEDSLTYEGLFYDYYFDTGDGDDADDSGALFRPRYSTAVSDHPITAETEYYLSVGLDSTLSIEEFERRRLNLVAVLDVSGSMGGSFDQYYYDEHGRRREAETGSDDSKLRAATESLAALTTHLEDDDRFGVVLYNSAAHVAKPVSQVGETDMDAIRGHIRDVQCGGGTNLNAGLETAVDLLAEYEDADATTVENRVVFMTDMMPNTGETGRGGILETVESAADRGIYTTFVGMGIDANADLAASLSEVRGANHYFVHSAEEFERRLDDEFEYMVTPLVFDLQLELSGDADVEAVYGSPTADRATGTLVHVSTLFPSPVEDGGTRGGVVLLKLAARPGSDLRLTASWEEIDGTAQSTDARVEFDGEAESFETTGVQKAVCLARYCSELREWIRRVSGSTESDDWRPLDGSRQSNGGWERGSQPLSVDADQRERFETLQASIRSTASAVADDDLEMEIDLLQTLVDYQEPLEHDLSKEARQRLRSLVELAPTKNAELAEVWGLTTGSEVHQYLETNLGQFYYRDDDKLLRPTEEALQLMESTMQ